MKKLKKFLILLLFLLSSCKINNSYIEYHFRNDELLSSHFEKHGIELGFNDKYEYEKAASDIANNENALSKIQEDGDSVYFLEANNDFVVISFDGYIRTYFRPNSGIDYFNRQ